MTKKAEFSDDLLWQEPSKKDFSKAKATMSEAGKVLGNATKNLGELLHNRFDTDKQIEHYKNLIAKEKRKEELEALKNEYLELKKKNTKPFPKIPFPFKPKETKSIYNEPWAFETKPKEQTNPAMKKINSFWEKKKKQEPILELD